MSQYDDYRRRDENSGEYIYFCPDCKGEGDGPLQLGSLHKFKSHMQREHGGLVTEESAGASEGPSSDNLQQETGSDKRGSDSRDSSGASTRTPVSKPKRISPRARELNNKFNRCISLCVKHLFKELSEDERNELENLRSEVSENVIGVEFDFEERLVGISGKWALVVALALLYVLPALPPLKEVIAKAKAAAEVKQTGASKK